jgi:hypothetical protein
MAVARQGTTAIASKARITRPPNSRSYPLCCAMGWLAGAAWRAHSRVARGIGLAALDAAG